MNQTRILLGSLLVLDKVEIPERVDHNPDLDREATSWITDTIRVPAHHLYAHKTWVSSYFQANNLYMSWIMHVQGYRYLDVTIDQRNGRSTIHCAIGNFNDYTASNNIASRRWSV